MLWFINTIELLMISTGNQFFDTSVLNPLLPADTNLA